MSIWWNHMIRIIQEHDKYLKELRYIYFRFRSISATSNSSKGSMWSLKMLRSSSCMRFSSSAVDATCSSDTLVFVDRCHGNLNFFGHGWYSWFVLCATEYTEARSGEVVMPPKALWGKHKQWTHKEFLHFLQAGVTKHLAWKVFADLLRGHGQRITYHSACGVSSSIIFLKASLSLLVNCEHWTNHQAAEPKLGVIFDYFRPSDFLPLCMAFGLFQSSVPVMKYFFTLSVWAYIS